MAGSADGYIRIDTRINQAGAQTGLAQLTKSLKGFAAAVGIAFGIAAVVKFGASCIKIASDLNEVQNVVDVTFGSAAGKVNEFAKSAATSYGLSELAAKRYSGTMGAMLKSMGFTTGAAADMSIEMAGLAGDMASFYNLDSEEAFMKIRSGISGETEPLKQLGVNLSEANLSAYALAQGITTAYSKMSEQNKALIRYNYLLDKTKDAQGDFARTSNSWANQVRVLRLQWDSFKGALGRAFIAVLTPVLQIINQVLGALNAAAVVFANFIAAVTGTQQAVTTGATAAADAVAGLGDEAAASGDAAKQAGKDAAKGLQGFDELNVMQKDKGGTGGGAGAATITKTTTDAQQAGADATNPMAEKMKAFFDKYAEQIQRVKDGWEELKGTVSGIIDGFVQQVQAADIGGALFEGVLNWVYMVEKELNLFIGVVGKVLLAFNVPATVEAGLRFLSTIFKTIGDAVAAVTPGIMAFTEKALVPIASWLGGKVRDAFTFLGAELTKIGDWFTGHTADFTEIGKALGDVAAAVWKLIEPLADAAWGIAKTVISGLVDALLAFGDWCMQHKEAIKVAWEAIKGFFAGLWTWAKEFFGKWGPAILAVLAPFIGIPLLVVQNWDKIKGTLGAIWDGFKTKAGEVLNGIKGLWTGVSGWFTEKVIAPLGNAFDGLKTRLKGVWDGIGSMIRGAVNIIIDLVNGLIRGVNKFHITIPSWVGKIPGMGDYGGKDLGFDIKQIPRLAKGAVIPPNRQFAAILGDQKSGVNIETPLDTMLQAFKAAIADMGTGGTPSIQITFAGELAALGKYLAPTITVAQNAANRAAGRTLQTV